MSNADASEIYKHEIEMSLDDTDRVPTSVFIDFKDLTTDEIYYFVYSEIDSLQARDEEGILLCNTNPYTYGTQINCKPNIENTTNYTVYLDFNMRGVKSSFQESHFLAYDHSVRIPTKELSFNVILPTGDALVKDGEDGFPPYSPDDGVIGSTPDGRHITVSWTESNPELGSDHSYRVFYEQADLIDDVSWTYPIIGLLAVLFIVVSYLYIRRSKSKKIETVLSVLHDSERKVLQMIMDNGGVHDQKSLVRSTGFSKAKMSRIIMDLENRGLIVKTRKGRNNHIEMKNKK